MFSARSKQVTCEFGNESRTHAATVPVPHPKSIILRGAARSNGMAATSVLYHSRVFGYQSHDDAIELASFLLEMLSDVHTAGGE